MRLGVGHGNDNSPPLFGHCCCDAATSRTEYLLPPQVPIRIPVSVEQFGLSEYSATESPGYEYAAIS